MVKPLLPSPREAAEMDGPAAPRCASSFLPRYRSQCWLKYPHWVPYFYYQFTQPVQTLSIKALEPRWMEMRGWMVAWQNYKRSQSQFILLTIRSNLFHANSSSRFQKVFFDINRSGCSCHNPPSATLHFDYTQLAALYSTSDGFLSPPLTPKRKSVCVQATSSASRTTIAQNSTWNLSFYSPDPHTIRSTMVIIIAGYEATRKMCKLFSDNLLTPATAMKTEKTMGRLLSENVLGAGTMEYSSQWLSHFLQRNR